MSRKAVFLLLLLAICHVACDTQRSYRRNNGHWVSHLFVSQPKSVVDAEYHCQSIGMHLAGAESLDELRFMWSLIPMNSPVLFAHVGARLNPQCVHHTTISLDYGNPCSRENIYQWQYGVADGPIWNNMWIGHLGGVQNPNDPSSNPCVQFVFGNPTSFEWTGGLLDNVGCYQVQPFFCSKYV